MAFNPTLPVTFRIVRTVAFGEKFGIGFGKFLLIALPRFFSICPFWGLDADCLILVLSFVFFFVWEFRSSSIEITLKIHFPLWRVRYVAKDTESGAELRAAAGRGSVQGRGLG